MDTICGAVITGVVVPNRVWTQFVGQLLLEWWFLDRVWTQFVGQLLLEWWFLIEYGHNLWGSYYWSGSS